MTHKGIAVLVAISFGLSGCATVKTHREFNDRHAHMQKVVMLPSDVQGYEVTFNAGSKPLADLSESMKTTSTESLKTALEQKGYEVTSLTLRQEDLDADPALKDAYFEVKKLYEQAIADMKAMKKRDFAFDVGSAGNYFAEKYGANAIVYLRGNGSRLSSGMTAAKVAEATATLAVTLLTGVAVGGFGQPLYSLSVDTAVIDADLGNILWYNSKEARDNFTNPGDKKTVAKFVKDTIQPLPDSKFKKPAEKKAAGTKAEPVESKKSNFAPKPSPAPVAV